METIGLIITNVNLLNESGAKRGGGLVVIVNFVDRLIKQGYKVVLLTGKGQKSGYKNCEVLEIPFSIYESSRFIEEVEKIAIQRGIKCIFNLNAPMFYGVSFLQSHTFIKRIKNSPCIISPIQKYINRKRIDFQQNMFNEADKAAKFIAMSEKIKDDYVENFNIEPERVIVSYPGCWLKTLNAPNRTKPITFGIVANSSVNKGGHLFVFVMGLVKLLGYKFQLRLIAPKYKKDFLLKGMVKLFGMKEITTVYPKLENMDGFYQSLDCLALPSLNEAFGLVVLEAMAWGKPCIVSSTAGVAEIINEENGFVFNRKSLADFVRTVVRVIKIYDDKEKFFKYREKAFQTAEQYSWDRFTQNILDSVK